MYYISGTKNTHSIINSVPVWSGYPQYFKIGTVRVIMFFSSVLDLIILVWDGLVFGSG